MPDEEKVRVKRRKLDSIITKLHQATPLGSEDLEQTEEPNETVKENAGVGERSGSPPRSSRRKLNRVKPKQTSKLSDEEPLPQEDVQEATSMNGADSKKKQVTCNGKGDTDDKIRPDRTLRVKLEPLESYENSLEGLQKMLGYSISEEVGRQKEGSEKRGRLLSESSDADGGVSELPRRVECTACGRNVNPAHGTICRHPLMNVLVCKRCSQYYNSGPFTRDEFGIDEQCRWCGDGGSLLCCDKCDKAFCKPCIKRNLGKSTLKEIVSAPEGEEWLCFCCNTKPLSKLVKACNQIMNILQTRKAQKTIFKTKKGSSLTDTPNQKERKSRLNSLGISSDGALSPTESSTKKNLDNDSEGDSDEDDSVTKQGNKKGHGSKHGKRNGSSGNVVVIGDDSGSENTVKTAKNSKGKRNKVQEDDRVKKKLVVIESDDENRGKRSKRRKGKQDRTSTDSSNDSDSNAGKQKSKSKSKKGQTKKAKTVEIQSSEEEEVVDSDAEKQASKTNSKSKYGGRRKRAVSNKRSKEDDSSVSDSDLSDFISMVKGNGKQAKKGDRKQDRGKAKKRVISDSEEEEEDEEEEESKRDGRKKRSRKSSVSQKQTRKRPRKVTSSEDASDSSDDKSESDVSVTKNRRKQQQKKNKKKKVASESDGDDVSDVEEDSDEDAGRKKKGRSKRSKKSSSESEEDKKKRKKKGKGKGKGKKKGQKKHYMRNDSDESDEGEEVSPSKRKGRKKIRKLIADEKLAEETQRARKLEEERRKRLLERTRNNEDDLPGESAKVSKLVLESDPDTKEAIVEVTEDLLQHLKPHQCKGIQFMYDCVIESVKSWKKDEPGGGCILAHCMGLGKTLQVVALTHTLMTHKDINMQRVLVVAPLNTVLNWKDEFDKWLSVDDRLEVLILQDIIGDNWRRADMLDHWFKYGGVLIMGYAMYRNLSQCFRVRSKNQKKIFKESLVDPGPDLVICDEGHILRNDGSAISKALNGIKTKRRIVLTGTPLQNNLIEYHCMVSFVKPNLLGTRKEFTNTFVNPIQNGQCADSTSMDVQIMKQRCHVLHKMLEGCVQRRDYSVLIPFLPRKHEYVIKVRLSALQRKLYQHFLSTFIAPDGDLGKKGVSLFSDYHALMRIWTHPWCLKLDALRRPETFVESDSLDDFVVHTDEEGEEEEEEEAQWESDKSSTSEEEEEEEEEEEQSSSDSEEERRKQRGRRRKDSSSDEEGSDNDDEKEDEVLPQSSRKKQSSSKASLSTVNIDGEEITVVDIEDGAGTSREKSRDRNRQSSKNDSVEDTKDKKKKPVTTSNEKKSRNNSNNDSDSGNGSNSAFGSTRSGTAFKDVEGMEMEIEAEKEWYDEFLTEEDEFNVQLSGKLVLLMEILADAEAVNDKVLVFSQSLVTLDLIEKVLGGGDIGGDRENWCLGCDYFRMDGSTSVARRQRWTDIFNDEDNRNARLFLISTKAGGLGINLIAANRVIVFDVSWNPSHDVQSIFRVYRFGQTKAVYVYRFIAQGTMEEKIYDRQVTKLAVSGRVVDEQQIERHFTSADLTELYTFNPDVLQEDEETEAGKQPEGEKEMETGNGNEGGGDTQPVEKEKESVTETGKREESGATKEIGVANSTGASKTAPERPTLPLPKDAVLADLINRLHPKWIVNYHEHDSLLQNIESEKLTEEEMKAAWEAYEAEKSGRLAHLRVPDPLQPNHAQTHQQVAERIRLNSEMLQQIQQITQLQEMHQRQEIEERMRRVRQQREQMYQQQREALLQQHQRRQEEIRRQNQLRFIQHMTQPAAAPQLQLGQNTINVQTPLPGAASTQRPPPPPPPPFQPLTLPYRLPSTIQVRIAVPPTSTTTSTGTPPTINLSAGPRAVGNNPQVLRPPQNPAPK